MVCGAIYLWLWAKRADRKYLENQERELCARLPNEWHLVQGGQKLIDQDFVIKVLSDQLTHQQLRPLFVQDDGRRRSWLFRYNTSGKARDECSNSVLFVTREPEWRLPRIALAARRWRGLASRQRLGELGIESAELLECWTIEYGLGERNIDSTRRLVQAVLPIMQHSELLRRADFNGQFVACVGAYADSPDAYLELLALARQLIERLQTLQDT
jgi:hypothetical protein